MTALDWVGRVIDGRYIVEALVGRGGMGVVLAARHKFTGARVAVKMVRGDLGLDAEIEARFMAEARMPATIGHRSVVKTLDAGKTADGELYLVMELLAGRSLRHDIMRGVGAPSVRRIGMELLDVLAAAHARGIVHRDVKPENIFLVEPDASVKLLDFGITKVLAGPRSVLPRTAAGVLLGTIEYMAPEQLADARGVDARADLWAVSVILYEMLAGRRPHRATTVEEMFVALVKGQPDPIRLAMPSATPDIEAFFARALEHDPARRFASAGEMAVALARLPLAASVSVVAKPAGGNVTMATGFAASSATPGGGMPGLPAVPAAPSPRVHGVPTPQRDAMRAAAVAQMPPGRLPAGVLTPFVATPALAGALPDPPPPQTAPDHQRASVAPAPTTGTIATTVRTIETPATAPRRRFGLVLGCLATVALGAGILIAATRGGSSAPAERHEGSQTVASAGTIAGPSVPPPHQAPSTVTPAVPAPATSGPPAAPVASGSSPAAPGSSPAAPASSPAVPASSKHSPAAPASPTQPRRHSGGSTSKNPPVDRAVGSASPPAAAPPGRADPMNPANPPASTSPLSADTCAAGCKALTACRLGSAACEADCAQNRTLHGCLQQAANDCTRFASCWFASSCRGVTPGGSHSCSEAMDCEAGCRNDAACICRCVAGLSVNHAVALLAYNGCALQCRDNDCIVQRCSAQARRCRAE